jgi:DNA-directed RNA polymerase specialized sigma24 family protein
MTVLKEFIDHYYPTVFAAAARLTGSADKEELAALTGNVLVLLWEKRLEFAAEPRPGVYLYKLLLHEVFSFLRQRGETERIRTLRDILVIDPTLYLSDIPPEDV